MKSIIKRMPFFLLMGGSLFLAACATHLGHQREGRAHLRPLPVVQETRIIYTRETPAVQPAPARPVPPRVSGKRQADGAGKNLNSTTRPSYNGGHGGKR